MPAWALICRQFSPLLFPKRLPVKAGTPVRGDTLGRGPGPGFLGGLGPAVEALPCSLEDTLCEGLTLWRWLARPPCREGGTPSEAPRKGVPFVQEGRPGTRGSVSREVWDEGQKSNFPPSCLGGKCSSCVSRSKGRRFPLLASGSVLLRGAELIPGKEPRWGAHRP